MRNLLIFFVIVNFDIYFFNVHIFFSNFAIAIKKHSIRLKKTFRNFIFVFFFDFLIFDTLNVYCNFFVFLVDFEIFDFYNIFLNFDEFIDRLQQFENLFVLIFQKKTTLWYHSLIRIHWWNKYVLQTYWSSYWMKQFRYWKLKNDATKLNVIYFKDVAKRTIAILMLILDNFYR